MDTINPDEDADVTGVDFCPKMVEVAQCHFPDIKFLEANACGASLLPPGSRFS
jgi:ubiquinone/menaquinone biosynthesis C-methylase UbiE